MKKTLNLVILGPQGSGKGTQAGLLAKKFELEHIETCDMLRELAREPSPLGEKVDRIINKQGKLVPTRLFINLIKLRIQSLTRDQGIVFDGSPRRLVEAKILDELLVKLNRKIDKVFLLDISEIESVERLGKRRVCRKCDTNFVVGLDITKNQTKCPKCGGKLYKRKDDTREGILARLKEYRKKTLAVANYYCKQGKLVIINGEQSIKKVHQDIIGELKGLI